MSRGASFLLLFVIIVLVSGCFVARSTINFDEKCDLVTKHYQLEFSSHGTDEAFNALFESMLNTCNDLACVLAGPVFSAVVIPVGSFIASGSVVVIGNTINWIEQQGKCDDSITQKSFDSLVKETQSLGGKVINHSTDLIHWLKNGYNKKTKQDKSLP